MASWLPRWFVVALLLHSFVGQAQKEATIWYFGRKAGFDFSAGPPQPLANSGRPIGGPAAVTLCDKRTGQLLFYSDATALWNRQHRLMPHGDSLRGFFGISQGVLAVPVPGQDQQYYVFTLDPATGPGPGPEPARLFYSVVDMRLDAGRGDVVAGRKNRPLAGAFNLQLTAVPHANGRDYWLLTRQWGGNVFGVYLVNANGIALVRAQGIGPAQPPPHGVSPLPADSEELAGFLKASPNGQKVAYATSGILPLSLFDFDAATGELSHYLNLGPLLSSGGLSFSPDNSKLYLQNYSLVPGRRGRNIISQFDLAAGSDAAIAASGMSIVAGNPATNIRADNQSSSGSYTMQLGPDGRLYGNSCYLDPGLSQINGTENLYLINAPNRRGFACEVRYQPFVFGAGSSACPGFPNFMQHYFNGLEPTPTPAGPCEGGELSVFPNPTRGSFQVQVSGGCFGPYQAVLYDVLGRRVYQGAVATAVSEAITIGQLAPGIYLLQAQFSGKTLHAKLVKEAL